MEAQFKVAQFTKELVAARLRGAADPCPLAARLVAETLAVALKAIPRGDRAAGRTIEEAVRGGLQGVLLADHDVPKAGLWTVREMARLARELDLEATETLISTLRGIASLKRLLPAADMNRMRIDLDVEFSGAADALSELLRQVPDPGRAETARDAS